MKLYLTLPNEDRSSLRYEKVVFLYSLAKMHIERMDHLKLEEIAEDIGTTI